jgi:Valyl-tRNA synthetase
MTEPLAPQYDPSAIESKLYARWLALDVFRAERTAGRTWS